MTDTITLRDIHPTPTDSGDAERSRPGLLPDTRRGWTFVLAVLLLAVGLRAAAVFADHGYKPVNDAAQFDAIATSLAHGHGFGQAVLLGATGPTAYRAPLYPITLAPVYAVFGGHSWTAGRLESALVGTALVLLIGVVAAQLWSKRVAAVAMLIAAVHPTLILYGTSLQLEPLLAVLVMAATAAALQHRRAPHGLRWPIATGVLIGLAALTRETGFLLIPGLAWVVWQGTERGSRTRRLAPLVLVVCALGTVLPWTIRNAVELHAFVPVSTSGGYTLAGTYNDTSMHDPRDPAIWIPDERDPANFDAIIRLGHFDEAKLDQQLRSQALDYIRSHPGSVLEAMGWNAVRWFDLQGTRPAVEYAQYVPYPARLTRAAVYGSWVLDLLALVGLAWGATRRVPRGVWAFPVLAFVFYSFLTGNYRYRAPFEPFVVLLAAFAVTKAVGHLEARRGAASAA